MVSRLEYMQHPAMCQMTQHFQLVPALYILHNLSLTGNGREREREREFGVCFCMYVSFDSLCPINHFSVMLGTYIPLIEQVLSKYKCVLPKNTTQ